MKNARFSSGISLDFDQKYDIMNITTDCACTNWHDVKNCMEPTGNMI